MTIYVGNTSGTFILDNVLDKVFITKYNDGNYAINFTVTNGVVEGNKVTFNSDGTIVYYIVDNKFYEKDGTNKTDINKTCTFTVKVNVVNTFIPDAEIRFPAGNVEGSYLKTGISFDPDWYLYMPVLQDLEIWDYNATTGQMEKINIDTSGDVPNPNIINADMIGAEGYWQKGHDWEKNGDTWYYVPTMPANDKGAYTMTVWYSYQGVSGKIVSVSRNFTFTTNTGELSSSSGGDSGGGTCIAEGTMITLANGSKKAVEDLRKGDMVMSFDHLTGEIVYKDVIIVVRTSSDSYYKIGRAHV